MANDEESVNGVPRGYAPNNFALRGKIMMGAIIILFTIVLLILCLHLYARWLLLRSRRNRRRRRINFASSGENNRQNPTPTLHSRGLELSILRSLPVFVFNSDSQKDGLECAVCLCEFEENEKGRLLPKCNHSFHIECIDMWFHSHSTCPLCRDAVKPDLPVPVSRVLESSLENPVEHQIPVDGTLQVDFEASSSEVSHCCRQDEEFPFPLPSSSSSSSTAATSSSEERASSDLFQKPLGFAITVDISGRTESFRVLGEELGFGPAISPSLKSPGNRILSLKRLLSRERRAAPSAFSCSFSSDTDLEQGRREQAQPHR